MKDFKAFDYKLYRHDLACNLKEVKNRDRNASKELLIQEQSTTQYQIAKLIKTSVYQELKSTLSINNKLDIIQYLVQKKYLKRPF